MAATPGSIDVRMEVLGEVQLHRRIDGMIDRTADLRPALEQIQQHLQRAMEDAFAQEGRPNREGQWAPLSPKYAAWKLKHFGPKPILTRSGRLRQSLTADKAAGAVRSITATTLEFGTKIVVGRKRRWNLGGLHQTGTTRGLPARRIISLSPRQARAITKIVRDHIWDEP